jgi:hypothetical protein
MNDIEIPFESIFMSPNSNFCTIFSFNFHIFLVDGDVFGMKVNLSEQLFLKVNIKIGLILGRYLR